MRWLAALLLVAVPSFGQDMRSQESITVERIIVDARVTDAAGDPITGLTAADFKVKIDGKLSRIESLEWIPENAAARELAEVEKAPAEVNTGMDIPPPQGRLLVFFIQTDFSRVAMRAGGQMKAMAVIDDLLDGLDEDDRVAVVSFDSHLKFRLDFTSDKRQIKDAMEASMLIDEPPPPPVVPMPSIARRLDPQAMKNASSDEKALLIVANALNPIPGPKSLILLGWGLGRYTSQGVRMTPDYGPARIALESARVSVFSLDITLADSHTLSAGLGKVAGDTGGFYASMNTFPQIALDRLKRTLAGHYELEVRKPETSVKGYHSIEVTTIKRGAVVMARTSYVDRNDSPLQ